MKTEETGTDPRAIVLEAVMTYEEALERVGLIADRLKTPVDTHIRPLVTVLLMCGIKSRASCEGHTDHGDAHPWITVELGQEAKLNRLLGWQNRPTANDGGPNTNTWVLESHPSGWCIIPQKLDLPLETLQRYALEFSERIRHMLQAVENGKQCRDA